MRYQNKVAVVTGAASGIGLATVERLISEGCSVVAGDLQVERGEALATRFGGKLHFQRCDVTIEADIKALMDAAPAQFGGLDLVFSNAGAGGTGGGVEDMDAGEWRGTMDLLLTSVMLGTKYATPHLRARGGGAIINTSSISALQAGYAPLCYSVAKAAVAHFTKVAAAELSAHRIRINAVVPGFIATSIFGASLGLDRAVADQMAELVAQKGGAMQPMGRIGTGADIAAMVAFLGSDDGSFITGTTQVVDGGMTIGPRHAWDATVNNPLLDALGIPPEQAEAMRQAMLAAKA